MKGSSSDRGGVRALALAATILLATLGCARFRFEPELPLRARSGDTTLTLEALRVGWSRAFVYEARSETDHVIAGAWLTVPTREPCAGGSPAIALIVDGTRTTVIPAGAHEIEVTFPRSYTRTASPFMVDYGFDDFDHDTVLDLETKDGLCVRAPAVSRSVRMTARNRTLFVIDSVATGGPSDNVQALFAVGLGAGRWFGSLLTSATIGFAGVIAGRGTPQYAKHFPEGKALPVTLDLRYKFTGTSISPDHAMNIGLIGLRYTNVWTLASTSSSNHTSDVHVVQGVLSWGSGPHPLGPFTHGERGTLFELSFPMGVVIDPALPTIGFSAGMEMRMLLPM